MNIKAKEYFDSLKGKKVAFVGMGVANVPCAEFCAKYGIEVYACDKRDKEYIGKDICDNLEKLGVHFSLGYFAANGFDFSLTRYFTVSKFVDWRMH